MNLFQFKGQFGVHVYFNKCTPDHFSTGLLNSMETADRCRMYTINYMFTNHIHFYMYTCNDCNVAAVAS